MVGNRVIEIEPAKPPVCEVEFYFLAQLPLGANAEASRDNARLVLRSDWSMASLAIRQINDAFFDNSRAHKREQQPFQEECRTG